MVGLGLAVLNKSVYVCLLRCAVWQAMKAANLEGAVLPPIPHHFCWLRFWLLSLLRPISYLAGCLVALCLPLLGCDNTHLKRGVLPFTFQHHCCLSGVEPPCQSVAPVLSRVWLNGAVKRAILPTSFLQHGGRINGVASLLVGPLPFH